jgi:hypothetical protein
MITESIHEPEVLDFLKKTNAMTPQNHRLIYYGIAAVDLIKLLATPEKCGKWPFVFVCEAFEAIKKVKKKYLVPYPTIPKQTMEDRLLAKLLIKHGDTLLDSDDFFQIKLVTVQRVIDYLSRNEIVMNQWTPYFMHCIQRETDRVKKFVF